MLLTFRDFSVKTVDYPAGMMMPRHDHPWTNVTAVIRGEILEQTDEAEHRGRSCSVVVKPAGTVHANRAIGPGPVTTIAVELFAGTELARVASQQRWSWREDSETADAALQLHRAARVGYGVEAAAHTLLAAVLTVPRQTYPAWLVEVRSRLDADEPLDLGAMARRVGLHPVYVSRAFRRITGRTLSDTVRDLRLGRARHLLSTTRRPLDVVAAESGFTDASHLSRTFRSRHSITPGTFRRLTSYNAAGRSGATLQSCSKD